MLLMVFASVSRDRGMTPVHTKLMKRLCFLAPALYVACVCLLLILKHATPLMEKATIVEIFFGPVITITSALIIWIVVRAVLRRVCKYW